MRIPHYKFCPKCSSGLNLTRTHESHQKRLVCQRCGFVFYQNSAPTVSAIFIKNNKILLTKRAVPPLKNYWDWPGGFLEYGEEPIQGLKREMKEELGVNVKVGKILYAYTGEYHKNEATFNVFYAATLGKGKLKPADDIAGIKWYPVNKLPKLAFGERVGEIIDAWREIYGKNG